MFVIIIYILLSNLLLVHCDECDIFKEKFANASANFVLCSIDKSRPITFCENCTNAYFNVLDSYQNMSKKIVDGKSCLDLYVNQDRLQIVEVLYDNSVDLWSRAKCALCFDDDISKNRTLSNITIHFRKLYEEYDDCVKNDTLDNVCSICMSKYVKLDNYYKSISNVNEKIGVCMDIVDVMNSTWIFWSKNCCKYRRHDEYIFIGSSIGVLLFTVLFYIVLLFYKEKGAPTIIQQSRFFSR